RALARRPDDLRDPGDPLRRRAAGDARAAARASGIAPLYAHAAHQAASPAQHRALRLAVRLGLYADAAAIGDGVCARVHDAGLDGGAGAVAARREDDQEPRRRRAATPSP